MKEIYVVFVASQYRTGEMIRFLTRYPYNHVALALESDLRTLYSYARNNLYEPLNGGFQEESCARYLYGGRDARVKVCALRVDDDLHARIRDSLERYRAGASDTLYNFADLLFYPFKRHLNMGSAHTCVSFVLSLLEIPVFLSLREIEERLSACAVYEGTLSQYVQGAPRVERDYFLRRSRARAYSVSCLRMLLLLRRMGSCLYNGAIRRFAVMLSDMA